MRLISRFTIAVLFILLALNTAVAWGPHGHTWIANDLFEKQESEIVRMCTPHRAAFLAGCEIPDITVVYYYTEGGKDYRATHNWNFQQEVMSQAVTEDEVCFAYGIGQHLITDSVAHTDVVPNAIVDTTVPNWLIHPILEKKYDSVLVAQYPGVTEETPHMLDAMYGPKGDRYFEMVEYALGENVRIDVKSDTTKLSYALGSFYETAYKPRGESWMFKMYPYLDDLTNKLQPLVGDVNVGNVEFAFDKASSLTTSTYNNWGTRYQLSPHGFTELNAANEKANSSVFGWFLILAVLSPLILVYYFNRWVFLLISPVLIMLMLIITYAFV